MPVFLRCADESSRLQLEATLSRLTAELASSREAAEGLRRDLRAAQTDGEGRDRQHDASTRDLRKELRDCDETIGCVFAERPPLRRMHLTPPVSSEHCDSSCVLRRRRPHPAARQRWRTLPSSPSCVRSWRRAAASSQPPHATRRRRTMRQWRRSMRSCLRKLSPPLRKRRSRPRPRPALPPSRASRSRRPMLRRSRRPKRCAACRQYAAAKHCLTACFVQQPQKKPAAAPERPAEPVAVAEPMVASVSDVASVDAPEAPPAAARPGVHAASAAPPPSAAPHAPLVDISVPYSPPAAGGDSDSEFELDAPAVKRAKAKAAKPKPSAPKAKASEAADAVEPPKPRAAAAPVPAAVEPAPERIALAAVASNVQNPPAAAPAKPHAAAPPGGVKKRKLLDVSTAVDTVPPAFLFGMLGGGGFTAPKLKPAF